MCVLLASKSEQVDTLSFLTDGEVCGEERSSTSNYYITCSAM